MTAGVRGRRSVLIREAIFMAFDLVQITFVSHDTALGKRK